MMHVQCHKIEKLLLFGVAGSFPVPTEVHLQQLPTGSRSSLPSQCLIHHKFLPFSFALLLHSVSPDSQMSE